MKIFESVFINDFILLINKNTSSICRHNRFYLLSFMFNMFDNNSSLSKGISSTTDYTLYVCNSIHRYVDALWLEFRSFFFRLKFGFEIDRLTVFSCKFSTYYNHFLSQSTAWLGVWISFSFITLSIYKYK